MRLATALLLWLLAACSPAPATLGDASRLPQAKLPAITLSIGSVSLLAEVADTDGERRAGLARREELAAGDGMLFVYRQDTPLYFTMRDTLIPLSIAFIDADGRIFSIQSMQPGSQTLYSPGTPGRYALEVPQGWFRDNGIRVGDRVRNLPAP
ncbi:DUF192 domain-containing protein [Granulosicoccaceae sp. 1_MG-2023]|nr:DUF192 domain-containing protein [Granulosicoccaceae sp. 1_MG-2023]